MTATGPITNGHPDDDAETKIESLDAGSLALTAVDRASIDSQVATAKRYPRSITKSLQEALTLATLDEETAGSMFYAVPRDKKMIEGPSARLAEIIAYSWGNLRADADIVDEGRTHITAMGTCFDLEKNVAIRVRVKRRITDKHGKRYGEDMIGVTSGAAISIALRNSVFKVVPRALVDRIYQAARKASLGRGGTIAQKRQKAFELFAKMGVKPEEIFKALDVVGMDDIGEEQLVVLRGLANALKDGETTVEQTFRPTSQSRTTTDLNAALDPKKPTTGKTKAAEESDEDIRREDQELVAREEGR